MITDNPGNRDNRGNHVGLSRLPVIRGMLTAAPTHAAVPHCFPLTRAAAATRASLLLKGLVEQFEDVSAAPESEGDATHAAANDGDQR